MTQGGSKYQWRPIRQGDPIPEGAVQSGKTLSDGAVFVALNPDGDCGKLNSDRATGRANLIYCFSEAQPVQEGWVLVNVSGAVEAWRSVCRGQRLPDGVVFAGERFGDGNGPMYVGRTGSESGKLLLDEDVVREIQCHHKGALEQGEVLVLDPCLMQAHIDADEKVDDGAKKLDHSSRWTARWMWDDAGVPTGFMPGPLRRLTRGGTQMLTLHWSDWQDLPSTVRDMQNFRNTEHARRPVRIETSAGVCDVYQSVSDLLFTLNKILLGGH